MSTGDAEAAAVEGNTRFALDLYARLKSNAGDGNAFFSPYSISTALAMTSAGARGDTARQMADTLHLPADAEHAHNGFGALIAAINTKTAGPSSDTLASANALWLQAGESLSPGFQDIVKTRYAAGLKTLDFAADPEIARQTINRWVEKQTLEKIRDLIGPGVIDGKTDLVLTNAMYFKGLWKSKFLESSTVKDVPFRAPGGRDVSAPLMSQTAIFRHFDGGTFQMLELPYQGDDRAMLVLLPRQPDGLTDLEALLTPVNLGAWIRKLAAGKVWVELPRFTITEGFELSEVLVALGMADAFDARKADFSGMTGHRDRVISAVIHKAFVEVNEAGTEAAAATAVTMKRLLKTIEPPPIRFRADHPFVVLIRDQGTGAILFLGRVNDPTR